MSRVPEDGVYTLASARNALERDEWDMPQYSPDDYQGMDGNNFAVCQLGDLGDWREVAVIGAVTLPIS